ncbi:Tautomerase/MIF [Saitoella complicata NRRL Y-17804]|nr:Tautomerase/MIF [Saitoella complicata NRRL Y-17804]ODQ54743.1 Tautomerase/MIF [Saitoella complicata NRRL Y-17804]
MSFFKTPNFNGSDNKDPVTVTEEQVPAQASMFAPKDHTREMRRGSVADPGSQRESPTSSRRGSRAVVTNQMRNLSVQEDASINSSSATSATSTSPEVRRDSFMQSFNEREKPRESDRIACSAVWIELRTNVKIPDSVFFAKALSSYIAQKFNRSEEQIGVTIEHGKLLLLGGTLDPAYFLTVTSLSMLTPTHNRRHAATMSNWLAENLGVQPDRGYLRFVDPGRANYAGNGMTYQTGVEEYRASDVADEGTPGGRKGSIFGNLRKGSIVSTRSRLSDD